MIKLLPLAFINLYKLHYILLFTFFMIFFYSVNEKKSLLVIELNHSSILNFLLNVNIRLCSVCTYNTGACTCHGTVQM